MDFIDQQSVIREEPGSTLIDSNPSYLRHIRLPLKHFQDAVLFQGGHAVFQFKFVFGQLALPAAIGAQSAGELLGQRPENVIEKIKRIEPPNQPDAAAPSITAAASIFCWMLF